MSENELKIAEEIFNKFTKSQQETLSFLISQCDENGRTIFSKDDVLNYFNNKKTMEEVIEDIKVIRDTYIPIKTENKTKETRILGEIEFDMEEKKIKTEMKKGVVEK